MDRLDAMRLFVRVADTGSFSRAAADLEIGQPTVSRRIQDLEAQLGADLFQRTTRALSLTEAGERFYTRARAILSDFEEAEAEVRGLDNEPYGQLRITVPHSLSRVVIAPALASFMRQYPDLSLDVISDDTYTDIVQEGIDVAFRLGELADSSLMAKRIALSPRRLWASPVYAAQVADAETPGDLPTKDALHLRHKSGLQDWALTHTISGVRAELRADGRFRASSGDMLIQAAQDGLGYILAPDWLVCEKVRAGQLVEIFPDWEADALPLHAVWSGGKLKGKARLLVDHIAQAMKAGEIREKAAV
ncbi:LysR family transcriptional regulator [Henriciella aquimarina]|uniref:LysR family transcriptional regulator n=1 Tax=Henriciella aquimarina TaxID=545261 RepID=UPI0009FF8FDF|nr:LysR family transcriptional regulator [Henriciella aquimarina]